jgi:hypothetical protein
MLTLGFLSLRLLLGKHLLTHIRLLFHLKVLLWYVVVAKMSGPRTLQASPYGGNPIKIT